MTNRLKHIDTLLASFSVGDFDKRVKLSPRLDEDDAVLSALHMLAEELKAQTISRTYFNNIFNGVSEMVLVLSNQGVIEELNAAVCERLGYLKNGLVGRAVDVLTGDARPSLIRQMKTQRGPKGLVRIWNRSFLTAQGDEFPVELTASMLPGSGMRGPGSILLTAKDIGARVTAENRLLRAVIDGQEGERLRLARDLHDGLGQQLAAAKFLVGVAARECPDPVLREKLQAANDCLLEVIDMKNSICYNLMPKVLEDFGLVRAVREMGERAEGMGLMRVVVEEGREFPGLPKAVEIDLFRVIQEFMANAVRHGEATAMLVRFGGKGSEIEVRLKENGKGFDPALVHSQGTGLRNMQSRIRSHAGVLVLSSRPGKGTEARIRLMVNP